ncbi:hypothetical protein I317_00610 [Kwoniella heveanensis CBS 569]|nr:hypothetical protein I317_00610 [Kwoniella heveanensis CBS 569]
MMTRSPSPSFTSHRSYSPQPSPAPFLTPNPFEEISRPLPKRLLSLQNPTRPSPYAYPFPSPGLSPSPSSSSNSSPSSRPTLGGSVSPGPGVSRPSLKRPGVPHRSHSFCASGNNTTFALASASASSNLSPDKTILVAPPLERTLSSIGSRGNCSPPSQQMQRPFPGGDEIEDIENRNLGEVHQSSSQLQRTPTRARIGLGTINCILSEKDVNGQATLTPSSANHLPSPPPVPTIMIHESTTPPRPSLCTMRNSSNISSRSSSFGDNDTIMTPTTPHDLLFGRIEENDEHEVDDNDKIETIVESRQAKAGKSSPAASKDVEHVAREVQGMLLG